MRSNYYFLAVVLVMMAVVTAVVSLLSGGPPKMKTTSRRLVYADLNKLATLHPSYSILVRFGGVGVQDNVQPRSAQPVFCKIQSAVENSVRLPELARSEVEAETAQSAMSAFSRLETNQRQALQARLRAIRVTMTESAKPELAAKIRDIERTAEFKQRSLATQLGEMRLSTLIKASALENIVSGLDGILPRDLPESQRDPDGVLANQRNQLSATRIELQRIEATFNAEMAAIRAEADDKIRKLRDEVTADVASRLAARENAERASIESAIAEARNEVLTELGVPEGLSEFDKPKLLRERPHVPVVVITPLEKAVAGRAVSISSTAKKMAMSLQVAIKRDVARIVRELAARKGFDVTFSRTKGVPDATGMLATFLRESAQWGPVLAKAGS